MYCSVFEKTAVNTIYILMFLTNLNSSVFSFFFFHELENIKINTFVCFVNSTLLDLLVHSKTNFFFKWQAQFLIRNLNRLNLKK